MGDIGADVYLAYINSLIATEESRKTSFESRGITVITTSGTLVTLLFGLVAVVTGAEKFTLPEGSHGYLVAAVGLFVAAACLGIVTNMPILYPNVSIAQTDLDNMTTDGVITADVTVAIRLKSILDGTRRANTIKSYFLVGATILELAAVVALAIAVSVII